MVVDLLFLPAALFGGLGVSVETVARRTVWGLTEVRNAKDVLLDRLIAAVADSAAYEQLLYLLRCQRPKIFLHSVLCCVVDVSSKQEMLGEKSGCRYFRSHG